MLQGILFDLDGTLLSMQMDTFMQAYFGAAAKKMGSLGMPVFLVTDCLWNPKNLDISAYPHGNFGELRQYIASYLPQGGQEDDGQ